MRIIHSLRQEFKLKDILAQMNFPKSTYEYWVKRFDRPDRDEELAKEIGRIKEENPNYGYRRVYGELKKTGHTINIKKVHRLFKKYHWQVTSFTRKSRKYHSYRGEGKNMAPNQINRRFFTCIPHQKIMTDTSEFKYYALTSKGNVIIKKLYLDPYMDMYNSEILSYSIGKSPSAQSIKMTLDKAIEITSGCPQDNKVFQSMSRKGNCYDNSIMENFFGLLKQEIYYGNNYYSFEKLAEAIDKFIKYYNEDKIKEKLNWMSPVEYRSHHWDNKEKAQISLR